MSKFSNTKLLIALVALAAIVAGVKFFDSKKGERNFRNELVADVDSAKISTILIYPKAKKGEEVLLTKEGNGWKVKINDTKSQSVDSTKMTGLFKTILGLKPTRLAARSAEKWKEFEVDTSGTHVIVKEGDKTTLDITIGKFNFIGGREVETFVRLAGEDETYAVNGFLDGSFGGIDTYRDRAVVKGNKDNWTKLTFALADTMRYFIEKRDSAWFVDGLNPVNAGALENYLGTLAAANAQSFIDDVDAASLGNASHTLLIDDTQGNKITIEGFLQNNRKIIRSSLNPDNLLNGEGVWEQVFKDKFTFLPMDAGAAQ